MFSKIESSNPIHELDDQFKYFTAAILEVWQQENETNNGGILLFVPSYPDFVRLRNHLSKTDLSFSAISEYSTVRDISHAQSHFLTVKQKVLLYTERVHHFRWYKIKGVKQILMYGIPANPIFYMELADFLLAEVGEGNIRVENAKIRAIFSKWDALKLERIVGTKRCQIMCSEAGDTFKFP